ncbi:hypothetical protein [Streptomyces sp. NPDC001744]|uniref:hypothetical protein n=1 Tax=Streptomyces sp. NPDC001744 TaxID=3364606 RepID=UPI0036AA7E3B
MDSAVLEDQDAEYELVLRFRPGGPTIVGVWGRPEVADQKLVKWIGQYGGPGVVLTLTATAGGMVSPVKSWTYEGGLQVAGAA